MEGEELQAAMGTTATTTPVATNLVAPRPYPHPISISITSTTTAAATGAMAASGTQAQACVQHAAPLDNPPLMPPRISPTTKRGDRRRQWTAAEDAQLTGAVGEYGEKNWKAIAARVDGRNHMQCLQRWSMALNPVIRKGHWTASEDEQLIRALEGLRRGEAVLTNNWTDVARSIPGRTSKQTYERWTNHLDPSIKKAPFALEEDALIRRLQAAHGNRWAAIARHLPGRPMEAVKTRWRSLQRAAKKSAAFAAKQEEQQQRQAAATAAAAVLAVALN